MPKYTPELKKRRIAELVQRLEKGIDVQARDMALVLTAQQHACMKTAWAKQKALRAQTKPKLIAQYELLVKRAAIAHGRHAGYDVEANPRSNVLTDRVSKKQELADKAKDAVNVAWEFGIQMVDAERNASTWLDRGFNTNIAKEVGDIHSLPRVLSSRSTAKRVDAKTKFSHKSIREVKLDALRGALVEIEHEVKQWHEKNGYAYEPTMTSEDSAKLKRLLAEIKKRG